MLNNINNFFSKFSSDDSLCQMWYIVAMNGKCPICKKPVHYPKGKGGRKPQWLPFCSERCKLVDLGKWLDADYRIPVKEDENEDSDSTDGDNGPSS